MQILESLRKNRSTATDAARQDLRKIVLAEAKGIGRKADAARLADVLNLLGLTADDFDHLVSEVRTIEAATDSEARIADEVAAIDQASVARIELSAWLRERQEEYHTKLASLETKAAESNRAILDAQRAQAEANRARIEHPELCDQPLDLDRVTPVGWSKTGNHELPRYYDDNAPQVYVPSDVCRRENDRRCRLVNELREKQREAFNENHKPLDHLAEWADVLASLKNKE